MFAEVASEMAAVWYLMGCIGIYTLISSSKPATLHGYMELVKFWRVVSNFPNDLTQRFEINILKGNSYFQILWKRLDDTNQGKKKLREL